jgi:hypothetical protein
LESTEGGYLGLGKLGWFGLFDMAAIGEFGFVAGGFLSLVGFDDERRVGWGELFSG